MLLWNRSYQQFDLVVSSVTTKVKGVARIHMPGVGDVVWDVVDYSGPSQVEKEVLLGPFLGGVRIGPGVNFYIFFLVLRRRTRSSW